MALVPLYREASSGAVVGKLKAGQNVTITEATVGGALEVTVAASGGGGGGGTPATTVVSGTTPGLQPVVGISTDYARGDHSHGTPPVPAHTALSSLAWTSAGHTGSSTAVAAWNGGGTATVVQATADETMLVRRAGILQWVPVVAAAVVIQQTLSSDFALSVIDIGGIATT
ncbi:MAG: hypothetical protein JHD30_04690 [Chloroflexi bacterium]|nr:hypothetical protein [Chloroflexota bacterium]